MSIAEFLAFFGLEAQCVEAVIASRWPAGFHCPRCGSTAHYVVGRGACKLIHCNGCRHPTSLTSGSLMEHTKLPLLTWFLAIYLLSHAKKGLSALALKRQIGVSYPAAWLLHEKFNSAMAKQDSIQRLSGKVQLDDAYLGGERAGGKPGRGSENKVPFVAAVSLNKHGHPIYLKLNLLRGFTRVLISKWAQASLDEAEHEISDGLGCFAAAVDAGCLQEPIMVGALKPRDQTQFKWVNTVLVNLKTTLAGTLHSLNYRKYAQRYLSAFACRFNRRFDLRGLVAHLIVVVVRGKATKKALIRAHAEESFYSSTVIPNPVTSKDAFTERAPVRQFNRTGGARYASGYEVMPWS